MHLDTESQNHVIAQLYKKIVRFNDFNGGDYFKTLDAIDRFIAQNKLACDFTSLIEAKTVKPNTFIDYIQAANATAVLGIRQGTPASLWILLISIVLFFAIHAE